MVEDGIVNNGDLTWINGYSITGELVISDKVTSLNVRAFDGAPGITNVTIPESVTNIWGGGFDTLTSITVSSNNPTYDSRDNCNAIIEKATNKLIAGCSAINNIPDSVTAIGERAFYGCTNLTSITIPSGVISVESALFGYCSNLTSVVIDPENEYYSSGDCNAIIEKATNKLVAGCGATNNIPDSVMVIGDRAFEDCTNLTSITIPNGVLSIGEHTFCRCTSLTSVTIPSSVTSIASTFIQSCSSLTSIVVDGNNEHYDSRNDCNAIIEKSSNTLVAACNGTDEIPDDVTVIGGLAFYSCTGITSITIPSSVERIDYGAFQDCASLTSITIPNSVTSIGDQAFMGTGVMTVYFEHSDVPTFGNVCFMKWGEDQTTFYFKNSTVREAFLAGADNYYNSSISILEENYNW